MALDAYKSYEGVLGTATANIVVATTGHTLVIQKVMLVNTDPTPQTVYLYRYSSATSRALLPGFIVNTLDVLEVSGPIIIEAGGKVTGYAGTASVVNVFVDYLDQEL